MRNNQHNHSYCVLPSLQPPEASKMVPSALGFAAPSALPRKHTFVSQLYNREPQSMQVWPTTGQHCISWWYFPLFAHTSSGPSRYMNLRSRPPNAGHECFFPCVATRNPTTKPKRSWVSTSWAGSGEAGFLILRVANKGSLLR